MASAHRRKHGRLQSVVLKKPSLMLKMLTRLLIIIPVFNFIPLKFQVAPRRGGRRKIIQESSDEEEEEIKV